MLTLAGCKLESSYYRADNNYYKASDLVKFSHGLIPYKLLLRDIDLGILPFTISDAFSLAEHIKRVNETSLEFPIIISPKGTILDGWHRVVKALLENKKFIMAVRLTELPQPERNT